MPPRRRGTKKRFDQRRFYDRVTRKLAERAYQIARFHIPSKTLKEAMVIIKVKSNSKRAVYRLFIPHYWARFLHDGRDPVTMKGRRKMVWFKNPNSDPRLKGGYPVRRTDVRSLRDVMSQKEFKRRKKEMVFATRAPAIRGKFWFSNSKGMRVFSTVVAPRIIQQEINKELYKFVGKRLWNMKIKHRL